jgi:hypothetical protein
MQGNTYMFFIVDDSGRSYYLENGVVSKSTTPVPIKFSPDGWKDMAAENNRGSHYFAMDRSLTLPLSFVEDGSTILKHIKYNYGIKGEANLVILKQKLYFDDQYYGFYYDDFYKGQVDYTTWNDMCHKVVVNIIESGIPKYVKSRENVTYEFPLDGNVNTRLIKFDGLKLFQKATYVITNGALSNNLGGHTLSVGFVAIEAINSIGAVSEVRVKTGNEISELFNTDTYFLLSGAGTTTLTVDWNFTMRPHLDERVGAVFGTSIILQLHIIKDASTRLANIPLQSFGGGDPLLLYDVTHLYAGSLTVDVPAACRCILYMTANQNREFTNFVYGSDGLLNLNYTYQHPTTLVKSFPPEYLFKQLVSKITDGKFTGESPLLALYSNILMTCGDAIRGLPGARIKITLSDFFDFWDTIMDVGMGVKNGKLVLDLKENWIDYDDFIDLGEVSNLSTSDSAEHSFSSIEIGYSEQTYDDVNGKNEVNNKHLYLTPNDMVSKKASFVSPVRVDPYGMELLRINLDGKTTTDNSADDDVFAAHVKKQASTYQSLITVYEFNRELNSSATGILDKTTIFNLFLSPKECFYRKGKLFHSFFYKMDDQLIKFQSTGKNDNLAVTTLSGPVIEKSDVVIGNLPPRHFVPLIHQFDVPVPFNLIELLDANPLKTFRFTKAGIPFKGLPVKVGIQPATDDVQTYQLLSAPDNDLTQLISIME